VAEPVTTEQIVEQRAKGWPDFHPEDFCHQCGRPNISWWADSDRWNLAVEGLGRGVVEILCPCCFVERWEKATGLRAAWHLVPDNMRAVD
jgi:hypothetical protein